MSSSVLLSPLTIRKTTLRNRIMLPSMVTHYCAVNGEVSERLIAYHAERAYGGVGLNMLESTSVDDTGKSYWPGVSIASDHFIKGLRRLTDAIHAHGGKAGIQLNHAGRLAQPAVSGHLPRPARFPTSPDSPPTTTSTSWTRTTSNASSAASVPQPGPRRRGRVRRHRNPRCARLPPLAVHVPALQPPRGRLWRQLRKTDARASGSQSGASGSVLGPDFPLFFRCSVEESLPGGITLELARDIARTVADNGIDLFNVSVRAGRDQDRFTGPPPLPAQGLERRPLRRDQGSPRTSRPRGRGRAHYRPGIRRCRFLDFRQG